MDCTKVNLKKGSKGPLVGELQKYLRDHGFYKREIDNDFGSFTEDAVKLLQRKQGNDPDGVFGPKTCSKSGLNTYTQEINSSKTIASAIDNKTTVNDDSESSKNSSSDVKGGEISPPEYNMGKQTDGYYYCSCGEKGYEYGRWKVTFVDRCAHADDASHKYKSSKLKWSDKKDVAPLEGQWTCEGCDADYCAVTGKEKSSTSKKRLTVIKTEKMPIKKDVKEPTNVNNPPKDKDIVKTYSKEELANNAEYIINETKKNGKNPDSIQIKNRENNNLDLLNKPQYMGLYENQNIFWVNNKRMPNWTTLATTANNPVKMNYQSNAYNCGPMSMSMASQMLFKNTFESEFVKVCETNKNGTDPKNLSLISKLGFSIKPIDRNSKAVKEALARGSAVIAHIETKPASCLGYQNNYGHYVLIDRINNSQYHVMDPTKGIKWCDFTTLDNATNGRNISYYEMKVA
ncbi:MAG: cysteine peptidase family C39 domain-containing protein [Methanobrevibacter sp.]|nr:cysteine peptidase family C39 domain-containing protein [Methanobrevibacter sp.]